MSEDQAVIKALDAMVKARDAEIAKLRATVVHLGDKVVAVPVDAIREMATEWAAHGMRMTDSTTAVIEWLGSLGGDA